ncbi:MAG: phosphate ABC transporter permease [Chloroflexi bacterium RBG_16_48_8]|nr:MAG: phosphate ABC transporter permease [Chloroflexi bacterium RBG_16_48_8]
MIIPNASADGDIIPVTIIRPSRGWKGIDFKELWRYRELLYFLIWRDIKVRYKQSLLGAAWAIIQPLLTMIIFTIFFGQWAGIPTDEVPQPVFYFAGILPWQFFQSGVSKSGISLVASRNLITKIYFPRIAVPIAPIIAGLLDFGLAFLILIVMMFFYGIVPTSTLWTLPLFLFLALLTAVGVGIWLAGLNVAYRDVGYVIPFLLQVWFFLSPIVYSSTIVPESLRPYYGLNPMVGVVQGFRWAIFGVGKPNLTDLCASIGVAIFLLVSGVFYFKRMERTFADVV